MTNISSLTQVINQESVRSIIRYSTKIYHHFHKIQLPVESLSTTNGGTKGILSRTTIGDTTIKIM